MIEAHFDASAFAASLRRASSDLQAAARQTLGQAVQLSVEAARASAAFQDRTGALRASIGREQRSTWHHILRANALHAAFVEFGTRPHAIEASRARALRFVQAGTLRFARRVQHPGTRPTHFLDEAATVGARYLDWKMEENLARVFAQR